MLTFPCYVCIALLLVLLPQAQADALGDAALPKHDEPVAGNPLLPGKGICDPQMRVYGDHAYLYASRLPREARQSRTVRVISHKQASEGRAVGR